ncbi:GNAT family N-acetyltransferase [Salimicrobium jeotgali]|uniref:Acetyltransferase, GNAT family protein n=1 Tax=Salimicrobium jeotgali TaxID=1230341 RepID=K2H4Q9_9BACI|nr:GNAT family N-acetyltransferase [Salimicrobium jeotgali]AKG05301.1 GNAT family N-acetyltransferase [Salimicrobium jeotgali]EKE30860.1 acetyltransferase, GNAT family protein [Salimicrobium jeotgali]MBM7697638.1 N-acetylglutamate synthase-like GNAT family acetyltransferase [Salimicrobium jeotgali]
MELKEQIEELEFALLQSFSHKRDCPWGSLFWNEDQPDYYDANHAHVKEEPDHPEQVIDEVTSFYGTMNIVPRFYLDNAERLENFVGLLKKRGFRYESYSQPVQLWNEELLQLPPDEDVVIEEVTGENYHEALEVESRIKEFGGKEVREKALQSEFNDQRYTHYLLKYEGTPCSTACLFVHGTQGRVESVATIEEYRGKALIGHILQHVQKEAKGLHLEKLWVHPINEDVEKVYRRCNFETILTMQTGHAFLSGKGIKEIQESSSV